MQLVGIGITKGGNMVKEADLYQPVKTLLESMDYEVYAEVEPNLRGNWNARADVVGYKSPAVCIVEMKTSLSMELVDQAYSWLPHAHYIYIAIPKRKKDIPSFVLKILKDFGIGIIEVDEYSRSGARVVLPARFNRPKKKTDWSKILLPEHQTWVEGGSVSGGYVTPYKLTIQRAKQYLARDGKWHNMTDILGHCETHYSNPKNSLAKALTEFEHAWCECKVEKGKRMYRIKA